MLKNTFRCTQTWEGLEKLDPQDMFRFCGECKKNVYQIKNYTDAINTSNEIGNTIFCGSFPEYLVRPEKRIFKIGLALFIGTSSIIAVGTETTATTVLPQAPVTTILNDTLTKTVTIRGTVKDEQTQETLPFATVLLTADSGIALTTTTDLDGNFLFKTDKLNPHSKFTIQVNYVGYTTLKTSDIKLNKLNKYNKMEDLKLKTYSNTKNFVGLIIVDPMIKDEFSPNNKVYKRHEIKRRP